MLEREKIIKELKESECWCVLFREDTKIAYFGGSELIGYRDNYSDYDIICITEKEPKKHEYNEFLMWHDKKIHIAYRCYRDFENYKYENKMEIVTLCQLQALKNNNTIFINDNNEIFDKLMKNADLVLYNGFKLLIEENLNIINQTIEDNKPFVTKFLYHLIYAKKTLLKEPIDEEYLKQIKRIRWQSVDQKYLNMCVQDIREIKEWYEKGKVDEN